MKIIPAISATEPALDAAEAMAFLGGITRQSLDNYKRQGRAGRRLAFHKIGGRVYFLASQLREFISPIEATPAAEEPVKAQRRRRATGIRPETLEKLRQQGYRI